MKTTRTDPAATARKMLSNIAPVLSAHSSALPVLHKGNVYMVTVPPSACHGCGGDGCKSCAFTGENLPS